MYFYLLMNKDFIIIIIIIIIIISKRMLALEKTSLTRENKIDWSRLAAATSKAWRDSGRGSARKPRWEPPYFSAR